MWFMMIKYSYLQDHRCQGHAWRSVRNVIALQNGVIDMETFSCTRTLVSDTIARCRVKQIMLRGDDFNLRIIYLDPNLHVDSLEEAAVHVLSTQKSA